MSDQKHIAIVATGGTIAATHKSAVATTDYSISQPVEQLVAAIPALNDIARISQHEVCAIDSRDMSFALQHQLINQVQLLLAQPDVDGVVITHGTDSLEETALLLHWCLKSTKPVVLTGAMRPTTALSADGARNLYQAVLTASNADAHGLGTVVVFSDQIYSARFVQKTHTSAPHAFDAPTTGALGTISQDHVYINNAPRRPFGPNSALMLPNSTTLPQVDLIVDHVGANPKLYTASALSGAKAIVVAAMGNGSLSPAARQGVADATARGVVCIRASRIQHGAVSPSNQDQQFDMLPAHQFSALAARTLTALALANQATRSELRYYLRHY